MLGRFDLLVVIGVGVDPLQTGIVEVGELWMKGRMAGEQQEVVVKKAGFHPWWTVLIFGESD